MLVWLAAVVLLGVNLRPVVASLPPLLTQVRDELGLSGTVAGLLTTVPVLCFGAFAPLAPWLAARVSIERLLVGLAALTAAGTALRGAGGAGALFLGTLLAGVGVALVQTLVPVLVRSRFAPRKGLFMGAFSMSLPLGAACAAALAVPLEEWLGGWEGALAVWALPMVLAGAVWARPALAPGTTLSGPPGSPLLRTPLAWWVALFSGVQSAAFFASLAWLPTILEDAGYGSGEAGTLLALASATSLVPAFLLPVLAARWREQTGLVAAIVAAAAVGVIGLMVAPGVAVVWVVVLGLGQGGALGGALILPVLRGGDVATVAGLTAMTLSVGYLVASLGPWLLGAAHDLSGGWSVPLAVLLALTLLELLPGWPAAKERSLGRD